MSEQSTAWPIRPMTVAALACLMIEGAFIVAGQAPIAFGMALGWLVSATANEVRLWGVRHGKCI